MNIHSILLRFYCLPMVQVLCLLAVATMVFLLLKRKFGTRRLWKAAEALLLLGWLVVIGAATLAGRMEEAGQQVFLTPFHSYAAVWNGANPELLRSNFMNGVLFYPAGLWAASLLPTRWNWWVRLLSVLAVFTALSIGIEWCQYHFSLGQVEADDVLHNGLGTALGAGVGVIKVKRR